jgi:hypothetical protein
MGPRCSSAETQVCHRSYIIAAIPAPEIRPTLTVQDIRPALPNQESGPALPGSEISPFIDVTEGEYTCVHVKSSFCTRHWRVGERRFHTLYL